MRPDEPVPALTGHPVHLRGDAEIALVVARGQIVQTGDVDVSRIVLPPGGLGQPAVPDGGALEFALVQNGPGDVIEPVQTFPVTPLEGGHAEGLKGPEVSGRRPLLNETRKGERIGRTTRSRSRLGGSAGRHRERDEQNKARRKGTK